MTGRDGRNGCHAVEANWTDVNSTQLSRPRQGSSLWGAQAWSLCVCLCVLVCLCARVSLCHVFMYIHMCIIMCVSCVCGLTARAPEVDSSLRATSTGCTWGGWSRWPTECRALSQSLAKGRVPC